MGGETVTGAAGAEVSAMGGAGGGPRGSGGAGPPAGAGGFAGAASAGGIGGAATSGDGGAAGGAGGSGGVGGATSGGTTGTAGSKGAGGAGGSVASGGRGGGASITATGGTPGTGGAVSTGGTIATGGTTAGAGGRAGAGGAPSDSAKLNFETTTQDWFVAAGTFANLARSTAKAFAGVASLGATLQYTAASAGVTNTLAVGTLSTTPPGPGSVITFHVYLPLNAPAIQWIQPFLQDTSFAFFGAYTLRAALTFGAWNTITLTVPSTALPTMHRLGVEFYTSGSTSLSDDVFVDSIDW